MFNLLNLKANIKKTFYYGCIGRGMLGDPGCVKRTATRQGKRHKKLIGQMLADSRLALQIDTGLLDEPFGDQLRRNAAGSETGKGFRNRRWRTASGAGTGLT